jgi:hypothetical protein
MRPLIIVKGQIVANRGTSRGDSVVGPQIHLLVFDAAPEALDKHIVAPSPIAIHADGDAILAQDAGEVVTGELAALIGVEDLRSAYALHLRGDLHDTKPLQALMRWSSKAIRSSARCVKRGQVSLFILRYHSCIQRAVEQ